jgi:hypothetical protein
VILQGPDMVAAAQCSRTCCLQPLLQDSMPHAVISHGSVVYATSDLFNLAVHVPLLRSDVARPLASRQTAPSTSCHQH